MLKRFALSTALAASALTAFPAAAEAQSRYGYSSRYDNGYYDQRAYDQRYDRRYYNQRSYNQRYYNQRYGRHYGTRCSSGSTGTILGAIAGGLLGREIAGRGDRTVGAIIGAGAGALAGRAIDRNDCRRYR
jgi:Glycine zipper 2TM domain